MGLIDIILIVEARDGNSPPQAYQIIPVARRLIYPDFLGLNILSQQIRSSHFSAAILTRARRGIGLISFQTNPKYRTRGTVTRTGRV